MFADTAEFIGHDNILPALALPARNLPLPENARPMNANGNGLVEHDEASGTHIAQVYATLRGTL